MDNEENIYQLVLNYKDYSNKLRGIIENGSNDERTNIHEDILFNMERIVERLVNMLSK